MAFKMKNDKRNKENINKLADHTKAAALKWYAYCESIELDILIYETIRTKATQQQYVAKGVSTTMRSWHLVGQALDFCPVVNGKTTWDLKQYKSAKVLKALKKAKELGFSYGGDWKTFKDYPHLQYDAIPYGTDTFGKTVTATTSQPKSNLEKGDKGEAVKDLQEMLVEAGYKISTDGIFGAGTEKAVKAFQKAHKLTVDGIAGKATLAKLEDETKPKYIIGEAVTNVWLHSKADADASTRVRVLAKGSQWKIYGEEGRFYNVGTEFAAKEYFRII